MKITYKYKPHHVDVLLDGKIVGYIESVKHGYAYFPKGCTCGQIYDTIEQVQKSLEDVE